MSATKLYNKLVKMRNGGGRLAYERMKTCIQLLDDRDWVNAPEGGGGNYEKALDRLEANVMADLCGGISLCALLEMFHHNQDIKKWATYKFNFRKLWADWHASQKPAKAAPKHERMQRATKGFASPSAVREMTPAQASQEYERAMSALETKDQKIARLETENAELRAENAELKKTIAGFKSQAKLLAAIA